MKKYFLHDGNNPVGPLTFEELKATKISRETLIWFDGIEDWTNAGEVNELKSLFQIVPPPLKVSTQATGNTVKPPTLINIHEEPLAKVLQLRKEEISDFDLYLLLLAKAGESGIHQFKEITKEDFDTSYEYINNLQKIYIKYFETINKISVVDNIDDLVLKIAKNGNKNIAIHLYKEVKDIEASDAELHVNTLLGQTNQALKYTDIYGKGDEEYIDGEDNLYLAIRQDIINQGYKTIQTTENTTETLPLIKVHEKPLAELIPGFDELPFDICLLLLCKVGRSNLAHSLFEEIMNEDYRTSYKYIRDIKQKYKNKFKEISAKDVFSLIDSFVLAIVESGSKNIAIYLYKEVKRVEISLAEIYVNNLLGQIIQVKKHLDRDKLYLAIKQDVMNQKKAIDKTINKIKHEIWRENLLTYIQRISITIVLCFLTFQIYEAKNALSISTDYETDTIKKFWNWSRNVLDIPDIFGYINRVSFFITVLFFSYLLKTIISGIILITNSYFDNALYINIFEINISFDKIFIGLCIIECIVFGFQFGFSPFGDFIKSIFVLQVPSVPLFFLIFLPIVGLADS